MNRGMRKHRAPEGSFRSSAAESGRRKQRLQEPIKRHGRAQGRRDTTEEQAPHATAPPPPPRPPPPQSDPPSNNWRAFFSAEHGRFYFYNLNTGETTWEPQPESQGKREESTCVVNQNIADRRGSVTVRSRSTVILSKGGKVQCGGGGARSVHPDESTQTPVRTGPSLQSPRHSASARAVRRLEGAFTAAESEGRRESRARHVPLETEGCERRPALRNKKRHPGDEMTPLSTWCGKTRRRKKGQKDTSPVPDAASQRVASSLLQAKDWLANNEEEIDVGQKCRRRGSSQINCAKKSETCARRAVGTPLAPRGDQMGEREVHQDRGMVSHEFPGASARLRGKAAAVWAAMEAQHKEEEEMTGTPEITRLGQSKHRSVDDLFLFQRNVEASRRHKRDERDTQEERLVTGRPETCSRSAFLVERMRRDSNGAHRSTSQRSTSQRLHEKASEQRRRQENLQTRVRTAIRRRATPHLSTRSRSLPQRGRRDVADRLYEQALVSKEEALERERLAQNPPRGATFRPEIVQRSGVLARRRRDRWASIGLGLSGNSGGSAVQEVLLAEGTLYNRRRQERRTRQEQLALRRQTPTVNRHSRRLLRDAERMGRSVGTQSDSGKTIRPRASQVAEENYTPRCEALYTSKRMLESRYGRDSIPSMEQRAKERELERRERRAQSAERDKENRNFVARRTVRPCSQSESSEYRHHPEMAVASGSGADIYQRTTEYVRRKESRRASEREALLAEELAGCTFAPKLPTRRHGRLRRQAVGTDTDTGRPCSARSPGTFDEVGHQTAHQEDRRVDDSVGSSSRPRRRHAGARPRQPIIVSSERWLSSPPAEVVGEKEKQEFDAEGGGSDSSVDSGGAGRSSCRTPGRWASNGGRSSSEPRNRRQEEGDGHSILRDGNDFRAEAGQVFQTMVGANGGGGTATVSRGGVAAVGSSLPDGWTAFTSPEGWEYFFHNETRVVQWKRPTR